MPQLRDSSNQGPGSEVPHSPQYESLKRIFGVETEYGVSVTGASKPCDPGQVAMMMFAPVLSRSRSTNTYLPNGSRLYLDVGSHPEYATAEACDPYDALVQDLAGEETMRRLVGQAQERLRRTHGAGATIHLYKNNVDSAGHSFGCHENYLVRRFVPLPVIKAQLLPFLITRQLFTGAGRVTGHGFEITQRAGFLDEAVSSSTTRSRPMVNTRDEPHADPYEFRRLHVIIGDSNRSQTSTMMKLATTHLVLCVIETAQRLGIPSGFEACAFRAPSAANKALSADLSARAATIELEDADAFRAGQRDFGSVIAPGGARDAGIGEDGFEHSGDRDGRAGLVSGLEVQYHYLAVVSRFMDEHGGQMASSLPRTECAAILADWRTTLDALARGDLRALQGRVDWIAKLLLIRRLKARDPDIPTARLRQIDMDYHDITNGSLYDSLLRHGVMRRVAGQAEVDRALNEPPADTRAALRGGFIAHALAAGAQFTCDWTHLTLKQPASAELTLLDPFDAHSDAGYTRLLARL
ncbi:proteasome accessory factor PafA2 family protein [Bifidobacterium sp. ESL0763]|uniref:proteasome accessory factor PafA2 family protein n=1 Tax=Bifidobacterium sp. ESL0763 TaxID=2983227 RepID=UPI0023F92FD7|nr:proteasome accessory factor PafA2 family protein [Bifidobacterium sp. ESL0763]MDF7663650.1 proteasome accessory factor PafA2 family protein [Bifidobacterium sp. ESL0763]